MKKLDILLIHTKYCPISWIIRMYTHSKWNHCAFILNEKEIFDCKSIGMKIRPLNVYLNNRYKVKLLRLEGMTNEDKEKVLYYMFLLKDLLKTNYLKFLKTLFLIFTKKIEPHTALTCSGLISMCLELGIGYCVKLSKRAIEVTPEDINKCKDMKNVTEELK